jgi:hypothetical protein
MEAEKLKLEKRLKQIEGKTWMRHPSTALAQSLPEVPNPTFAKSDLVRTR